MKSFLSRRGLRSIPPLAGRLRALWLVTDLKIWAVARDSL